MNLKEIKKIQKKALTLIKRVTYYVTFIMKIRKTIDIPEELWKEIEIYIGNNETDFSKLCRLSLKYFFLKIVLHIVILIKTHNYIVTNQPQTTNNYGNTPNRTRNL